MPHAAAEHPTWAEINLSALRNNLEWVQGKLSRPTRILAVVKADAYGHGAVGVAGALTKIGVDYFGVAHVREGEILRSSGVECSILILSETMPELVFRVARGRFSQTVYTESFIDVLEDAARKSGVQIPVHLKIDTGMGRVGALPEDVPKLFGRLSRSAHLKFEGIYTHFARADETARAPTLTQLDRFQNALRLCGDTSHLILHAANSAALLHFPETHLDMVRVGILLYGISPIVPEKATEDLTPVMSLKTDLLHIKDVPAGTPLSYGGTFATIRPSRIATIAVGYADGLPSRVSNRAFALVRGKRFPLVGRVTMDMTMLDVTDGAAEVGDEVVLIGAQGVEQIRAEEMAALAEEIPYEIVCGIGKRIPRILVGSYDTIPKVATAKF